MRIAVASSCRFYSAAKAAVERFTQAGFMVHHPNFHFDETVSSVGYTRKVTLTRSFLNGLDGCSALYVINTGGYIGMSVCLEIGYARALRIPVWTSTDPTETAISAVTEGSMRIDDLVQLLRDITQK
jgi:hypothetical protein